MKKFVQFMLMCVVVVAMVSCGSNTVEIEDDTANMTEEQLQQRDQMQEQMRNMMEQQQNMMQEQMQRMMPPGAQPADGAAPSEEAPMEDEEG